MVSECGNDLRIANRLGDLHLHGDNDGWLYGWDEHDHGHNHGNAEQHDCEEFGIGHGCADALYQHSDYKHHVYHDDGNGSDVCGPSCGCYGELVSECGDNLRIANRLGDLHLHGDNDGRLYGRDEHGHGHNHGNAEQHSGSAIEHTDPVY